MKGVNRLSQLGKKATSALNAKSKVIATNRKETNIIDTIRLSSKKILQAKLKGETAKISRG